MNCIDNFIDIISYHQRSKILILKRENRAFGTNLVSRRYSSGDYAKARGKFWEKLQIFNMFERELQAKITNYCMFDANSCISLFEEAITSG